MKRNILLGAFVVVIVVMMCQPGSVVSAQRTTAAPCPPYCPAPVVDWDMRCYAPSKGYTERVDAQWIVLDGSVCALTPRPAKIMGSDR